MLNIAKIFQTKTVSVTLPYDTIKNAKIQLRNETV